MNEGLALSDIGIGDKVRVDSLNISGSMRRRLLDIGLIKDTEVECIGVSPGGDMAAYLIRGAVIALRKEDSRSITVQQKESRKDYDCSGG